MKVLRKWIEDNAVNGQKIRLDNNEFMRARNAANTADINILKVNALNVVEFASIPQAAGTPSSANDLVNLGFLDQYVSGLMDGKDAVRAAATSQIALAGGAVLTVDGVALVNGDRVLLAGQTLPAQNGIYDVSGIGAAYTLTRSSDMDSSAKTTQGLWAKVVEGTAFTGYEFVLTTPDPIVLGTTPLTFIGYPAATTYVGGDMISISGSTISIDLQTNGGLESSNPGNVSGQIRVKVHAPALQKDKTIKLSASGEVEGLKARKQVFPLIAADITNGYVDLDQVAHESSIHVHASGSPTQNEGTDYTLNYTGGSGSKTRVSFAGDLTALLAAGDSLFTTYLYI